MRIDRLRLANFRNYELQDLSGFGDGINMICGPNAQGKTNLLEAMYLAANGKSFRATQDRTLVREGEEAAYVRLLYSDGDRAHTTELMIGADHRKSYRMDSQPVRALREIIGHLLMVSFSPDDIRTAQEGPGLRRNLLDSEISKIVPAYVGALKQYTAIVQEKNKILKQPANPDLDRLVGIYNEQAVPYIGVILKNRRKYLENLNKYVSEVQNEVSSGQELVSLSYRPTIREEEIGAQLDAARMRERQQMYSVIGPHRDDVLITLNGRDVRQYASQGQVRSVMLSVKVACVRALRDVTRRTPILLLDDVFSELDPTRKERLVGTLGGMQTFITTADPADAALAPGAPVVNVRDGQALVVQ